MSLTTQKNTPLRSRTWLFFGSTLCSSFKSSRTNCDEHGLTICTCEFLQLVHSGCIKEKSRAGAERCICLCRFNDINNRLKLRDFVCVTKAGTTQKIFPCKTHLSLTRLFFLERCTFAWCTCLLVAWLSLSLSLFLSLSLSLSCFCPNWFFCKISRYFAYRIYFSQPLFLPCSFTLHVLLLFATLSPICFFSMCCRKRIWNG